MEEDKQLEEKRKLTRYRIAMTKQIKYRNAEDWAIIQEVENEKN